MLNKLRRRIVLSAVLPIALVLLVIFSVVSIFVSQSQEDALRHALDNAVQGVPPQIGPGEFDRRDSAAAVVVFVQGNQIVYDTSVPWNGTMDEDALQKAVGAVIKSGVAENRIDDMGIAFKVKAVRDGRRIAFVSTERYDAIVSAAIWGTGGACLAIFLCMFVVVLLLSRAAVRPIAEAWEQQRRFIADASHDLKTPLTVILANLDILNSHLENVPEEDRRWLESTREEAERMKGLTLSLLELAKTEHLKEHLTLTETDISTATEQVVLQYEPVAFDVGVELVTEVAKGVVAMSDTAVYKGLVETLVDNAVKYSPKGERVTVRLTAGHSAAALSVHNTGEPIPEEDLAHIFDRFHRVDKARKNGGYGLGLAIAHNMAEALEATLTVTSDKDSGTVFYLAFHASKTEMPTPKPIATPPVSQDGI